MQRREFLRCGSSLVGGSAMAAAFGSLLARSASADPAAAGYGPLIPTRDPATGLELLQLPDGFRYVSFSWADDPLTGGGLTPGFHDGMAVIGQQDDHVHICRNHQGTEGRAIGDAAVTYDPGAGGGCVSLTFDTSAGRLIDSRVSLSGTARNCAGGPTPWGTWLSCEETVVEPGDRIKGRPVQVEREHGFVFEVPADKRATAEPLKEMGRFVHEAVAVDPATGIVYETEDQETAGCYRFLPRRPGRLAEGGRLQMMKVHGRLDMRKNLRMGATWDTSWVDIEDPLRRHSPGREDGLGVFHQGKTQDASTFARLEGCWFGDGKIYVVSTIGGDAGCGQVFQYDPREETITLIFESPGREVLSCPDNLAVSPKGGLVLCEDGDHRPQRLHGMTSQGEIFALAANHMKLAGRPHGLKGNFRGREWSGATFSADGQWLFANIQRPGVTFAITGPWQRGPLG